ncbi:Uncharacterized protein dnm_011820 [Desulfonema magnum]|uniref:Uncharacterized protein n=1 Tax=Desulfonema magnum TaxID=45655 RepID=A0A975BGP1_9BACT|nr:Uncharacterized protein dnm_011820 [Desulfonema magnum]
MSICIETQYQTSEFFRTSEVLSPDPLENRRRKKDENQ